MPIYRATKQSDNCPPEGKKLSPNCSSVKVTLNVIGGKWKPIILFILQEEAQRFSQIFRQIDGITQKMLTQQLRELEADGLINRKVYPEIPPKVEYSMTEYGKSLNPILKLMHDWGKNHRSRNDVKPLPNNPIPEVI